MESVTDFFIISTKNLIIQLDVQDSHLAQVQLYSPTTSSLKKTKEITAHTTPLWLQQIKKEALEYLDGKRENFSLNFPLTLPAAKFYQTVYHELRKTRAGETLTYKELAERCGSPGAARAVGGAMRKNPLPLLIPCHRVVPAHKKSVGAYSAGDGEASKVYLLQLEQQIAKRDNHL